MHLCNQYLSLFEHQLIEYVHYITYVYIYIIQYMYIYDHICTYMYIHSYINSASCHLQNLVAFWQSASSMRCGDLWRCCHQHRHHHYHQHQHHHHHCVCMCLQPRPLHFFGQPQSILSHLYRTKPYSPYSLSSIRYQRRIGSTNREIDQDHRDLQEVRQK